MDLDFMQRIDQLDPFTKILILMVTIIFIGMFIVKYSEFPEAILGLIKWVAIALSISLIIYGLSIIWPSVQQFFSKIFELFSVVPEFFSGIPKFFSKILEFFSRIPELWSSIVSYFASSRCTAIAVV